MEAPQQEAPEQEMPEQETVAVLEPVPLTQHEVPEQETVAVLEPVPLTQHEVPEQETVAVLEPVPLTKHSRIPPPTPPLTPPSDDATPADLKELATLISGCKSDVEGVAVKQHLVESYVAKNKEADYLQIIGVLHEKKCITMLPAKLLPTLNWQQTSKMLTPKTPDDMVKAAANPFFFLTNVLEGCEPGNMAGVVAAFIGSNPQLDAVELINYVHANGFISVDTASVNAAIEWTPPTADDADTEAGWRTQWGSENPIPEGGAWYATLRDHRGNRMQIAFLGSVDGPNPSLTLPSQIMIRQWKRPKPAMAIVVDAGSMHPRQCDSISRMCHLPQYQEWVTLNTGGSEVEEEPSTPRPTRAKLANVAARYQVAPAPPDAGTGAGGAADAGITPFNELAMSSLLAKFKGAGKSVIKKVKLSTLMATSLDRWRQQLPSVNTDEVLGDSSINNLIFMKLKAVFAAMLDAATLAGSWVVVDRTDGSGSATAELLLEMAIERGTSKPTVLVIDSLERLGSSREGSRSRKVMAQLRDLFASGDEFISQTPNGSERDFSFDYKYTPADFEAPQDFADVPDHRLPFEVLADHQRAKYNDTCDPSRKWRYFYIDGLFKSGTHIVIKNNDTDEFNLDEVTSQGFLYAHGDTRTFKRLRANIQLGKPIVMLHNSGGCVTAFSWLQRVMAHQRPPPATNDMQGPLRYLIANLSEANWTLDMGAPDVLMMRALAERAPMLFRKNVISVDILTQSEEEVLESITGCFSQAGGVPELGLGNAEVNVIFSTWMAHLTLCENARTFHRFSVIAQWVMWILSIAATAVAVTHSSLGSGVIAKELHLLPPHEGEEREFQPMLKDSTVKTVLEKVNLSVIIIPIMLALIVTINSRMKWRDKWSVCITAADYLASEIYKFRLMTCEYDLDKPPGKDEDGNDLPPLSQKEKSRRARMLFVDRVQAFQAAALTEISQSAALKPTKTSQATNKKVPPSQRFLDRQRKEEKPTLAQWWKLKIHLEEHFHRTSWAFPRGVSFLSWMSMLRPYLSQATMREEMTAIIKTLSEMGVIRLKGAKPLSDGASSKIRHALAAKLGLPPKLLDGVKDEIRLLQRTVVMALHDEQRKKQAEARKLSEARDVEAGQQAAIESGGRDEELADESTMREMIMEMQGLGKPVVEDGAKLMGLRKRQKKSETVSQKIGIDDDYLAGPMTIDTYMTYRVRPVMAMLQSRAESRSRLLSILEIVGFCIQSSGAIFGTFAYTEWVALTVALAAVVQSFIEFMSLRDQVTAVNLALVQLQTQLVFWDSLSIVRRRTPVVKMQIAKVTEDAILMVVNTHTTAASNTITSVEKSLAMLDSEDKAEDES